MILSLYPADSKTLKEEKREELFENLKANESIGWAVDVIDPRELSAKMLKKLVENIELLILVLANSSVVFIFVFVGRNKINLNEISHDSAIGLVSRVLGMGVLLTEVNVSMDYINLCVLFEQL